MKFEKILVVCTGNICRSPLGEYCLRQLMPDKLIRSAGLRALAGHPADPLAQKMAVGQGLSLSAHKGQQFTPALGQQYDLILVMEQRHRTQIIRMAPELGGKTLLFGYWSGNREIPDPYGDGEAVFARVSQLIRQDSLFWSGKLCLTSSGNDSCHL
ncbi:TPA: protein tyrosine phosphatase [Citrobacter werkmanii]|nr:protein tyrosine phosphatase [Citrobacter werkmanii]